MLLFKGTRQLSAYQPFNSLAIYPQVVDTDMELMFSAMEGGVPVPESVSAIRASGCSHIFCGTHLACRLYFF